MYIQKLRDVLWPGGQLDTETPSPPSEEQKQHTRAQARQCLINFFPGGLQIGSQGTELQERQSVIIFGRPPVTISG